MYEEIYELPPNQGWGRRKYTAVRSTRWRQNNAEKGFKCQQCGAYVYTMPGIAGFKIETTAHSAYGHGMSTI